MSKFKRLLNHPAAAVDARLRSVCDDQGARVFAKVRMADVLPIDNSGISNGDYGFALRSHFDFVVTEGFVPIFTVEYDGPGHSETQQRARDQRKDALCDAFDLPLLRINTNHVKRRFREMDLLTWFVEMWFGQRAIDEAYENGTIPADEWLDPLSFISLPGHRRPFPLMIGLDAQCELKKLHEVGKCTAWGTCDFIGYDSADNVHGLAVFQVGEGSWTVVRPWARKQLFPVVLSDLVRELLMIETLDYVRAVIDGRERGLTDSEALDQIADFGLRFDVGARGSGPPFPSDGKPRPGLDKLNDFSRWRSPE